MIILYGIANCDTIKKTRNWLDTARVVYQFHDYRKDGSPETLIRKFAQAFDYHELVNTRGTTWRKLPESARRDLDQAAAIALMCAQPALIKRPLLQSGNNWLLGYDEARLRDFVTGD